MTGMTEDRPDHIHSRNLPRDIVRAFFGSSGGVSSGIHESLNCGFGSEDAPENVKRNRERVARDLDLGSAESLVSLQQAHGTDCVFVEEIWSPNEKPQADAMVTKKPGIGLGILTADCAPVLLSGRDKNGEPVVGAVHAGWRGALGGVLEATIETMRESGADVATMEALVGPCLQRQSYEVDPDFKKKFLDQSERNEEFFAKADQKGKYLFDLSGYIVRQLKDLGVKDIISFDNDTFSEEDRYFSYRRNIKNGIEDYGRQISVIAIRAPESPTN